MSVITKKANNTISLNLASFRIFFSLIFILAILPFSKISAQVPITFENNIQVKGPGNYHFVASENVRMTFEAWGGGGRGGSRVTRSGDGGGGGGGGAYARVTINIEKDDIIEIVVGTGGIDGSVDGKVTEVKLNGTTVLKADGGKGVPDNGSIGALGGLANDCIGDLARSGGKGADGRGGSGLIGREGGGGGSSAGPASEGNNGSSSSGGVAPVGGGGGGDGKSGVSGDGSAPGGGGGGAKRTGGNHRYGGKGGGGQIRIARNCRSYWYKADMLGGSFPADGVALPTWKDQSNDGDDNDGISSISHPTWHDNKINFNPAVKFTNGYYLANRGDLYNDMGIYVVFSTEQNKSSSSWWEIPALIGNEAPGTQSDWGLGLNGGKIFFKSVSSDDMSVNPQTAEAYNTGSPVIASGFRKLGEFGKIYVNGIEKSSTPSCANSLDDATEVGIGRNPTVAESQFIGYIAEVTGLSNVCSTTDRHINDTYFAIKYGITIDHDYKRRHVKDSVIYSIATHNHDIAGLGRQDFMLNLHQKISSSSNVDPNTTGRVIIATSTDFTGSNVTSEYHKNLKDGQYLVWGHNNESDGWIGVPNTTVQRQKRVWKIQNTANVDGDKVEGTYLQIDLNTFAPIDSNNKSEIYALLLAKDSLFTEQLSYVPLEREGTTGLYSTTIDFPEGVSYFSVANMNKNYWTGVASTDWNTLTNWGAGFIPHSEDDVIFATEDNYGTAAFNDMKIPFDTNIIINNLINDSDKNLVIPTNSSLKVRGVVSIDDAKNPNKIQILAGKNDLNGSFIVNSEKQKNSNQEDIYVTVQMFSKAECLVFSSPWVDNIPGSPTFGQEYSANHKWQFFGIPVQSIRAEDAYYSAYVRQYLEDYNGDNQAYFQKWKHIYNDDILEAFKGYEITQESPTRYTIQGKLVYGDQKLTMTRKAPAVNGKHYGLGQNIFGNSFTAAVNVDDIIFPEEAEHTVYLYNTGSLLDWDGGETGCSAGQYTAIPYNSDILDGCIPSMNGFLVRFTKAQTNYNDSDVSLLLRYIDGAVKHNTRPQTAPRKELSYLEMMLTGENNATDRLWLYSQSGTTSGFDNGWDGFKFFGTPNAFIFTETKDGPMQVDADETINGKMISFYANKNGEYTLHLVRTKLRDYENLHLLDLKTNEAIAIDRDTVFYTFTAETQGNISKRFVLTDSPLPKIDNGDWALLSARVYDNNILIIHNLTTELGHLMVYETGGRLVLQDRINNPVSEYYMNLGPGVYIVQMLVGINQVIEKVIVH